MSKDYMSESESESYEFAPHLDDVERTFYLKVVPVLGIGLFLWFCSTLIYGGVFYPLLQLDQAGYMTALITYIVLWIITIVLAFSRRNNAAMVTFFISAFLSGVTQSPVIMWAAIQLGSMKMASNLFFVVTLVGIIAVSGALFVGYKFGREATRNLMWVGLIGLVMVSAVEIGLIFTYGYNPYLFWTSLAVLLLMFATILYDGANLKNEVRYAWMLAVLTIFVDLIVVIVRLFIIVVSILSDR